MTDSLMKKEKVKSINISIDILVDLVNTLDDANPYICINNIIYSKVDLLNSINLLSDVIIDCI